MKNKHLLITIAALLLTIRQATAQARLSDENTIFWTPLIISTRINDHFALHTEYQWRRVRWGETWQQSLLRLGLTYNASKTTAFQAGYGWILTYPYGDWPIAANGTFTEHRIYQQVQFKLRVSESGIEALPRIRLEQRWLAALNPGGSFSHWNYVNRIRLQQRYNFPFKAFKKDFYASIIDDVFIGFGRKVGQNVFDQNRLYGLLGWNISKKAQLELGVLNQILQQPRTVGGSAVFQYNTGPVLGCNLKL